MTPEERGAIVVDCLMAYARATMPGDRDSATHLLMRSIDTWIAEARADERRNTAERIAQAIEADTSGWLTQAGKVLAARIARDEAGGDRVAVPLTQACLSGCDHPFHAVLLVQDEDEAGGGQ